MLKTILPFAALATLTACGDGNPFGAGAGGTGTTTNAAIPAAISSTVSTFTFNPSSQTLTVTGVLRDEDAATATYRRRPALDQGVYQAYTIQDDALDEHTTAFVRERGDVAGVIAVTGGQFTFYSGGVNFRRSGGFDPIMPNESGDTGLVTYAGEYIGLTNLNGPDTDLIPVGPAFDADDTVRPSQAGHVNGRVIINVSFSDNDVAGEIYQRAVTSDAFGVVALPDLVLVPDTVATDGTFAGQVELRGTRRNVGEYAGIIGGNNSDVLAGGIFAEEHFDTALTVTGEEEFGLFVLGRCGGPQEDPSVECSVVDPE